MLERVSQLLSEDSPEYSQRKYYVLWNCHQHHDLLKVVINQDDFVTSLATSVGMGTMPQ